MSESSPTQSTADSTTTSDDKDLAVAMFGAGCFWCVEAVFEELDGVESAVSGYAGGSVEKPTYEQVCSGATGHAEVVKVKYDPKKVSFLELLEVFFKTHDPTTLNRQGADVGTQYRSVVFYCDQQQKEQTETAIKKLNDAGAYLSPIVTQVAEVPIFYAAEKYHQDYFKNNPAKGYCAVVIRPKIEKFREAFGEKLKKD